MDRRVRLAALIWGLSILAARAIGVVREAAIGRTLGLSAAADVYQTAFVLPDFLHYLLAGGAIGLVFIPIYAGHLGRGDEARARAALAQVLGFVGLAAVLLIALAWLATPGLAALLAPGFDAAGRAELVRLTRIVLPAQACHLLGGVLGAALQARDRHGPSALAPLLYTACVIAGGLAGGRAGGADGFAWGVVAGSALGPLGLPAFACWRAGILPRPRLGLGLGQPDLRSYVRGALPVMLGFSIVAVDDWILRREGSLYGDGAVAALAYAKALMRVPMGVFGLAMGVAAFPALARLHGEGRFEEESALLHGAVRRVLLLALAAQVGLSAAGAEAARLVYGATGANGAAIAAALAAYSLGLAGFAAQGLLARGFYARGRTWAPTVLGSAIAVLAYPVYRGLGAAVGPVGLALASAVSITAYAVGLAILLCREPGERTRPPYGAFLARAAAATAAGIGLGLAARAGAAEAPWLLRAALASGAGLGAYVATLWALGDPDLARALGAVRARLGRRRAARGAVVECPHTHAGSALGQRGRPEGQHLGHHEEGAGRGDRRRLHDRGEPARLPERGQAPP